MTDFRANSQRTGRPQDPYRKFVRELFADWSDRTFAAYWRAMRIFQELEGNDAFIGAVTSCTRPNGSLNVSELDRLADAAVMRYVAGGARKAP